MTFEQYARARWLLAEESIGAPGRADIRQEEAQFVKTRNAIAQDMEG
jgi:hypothetical protein